MLLCTYELCNYISYQVEIVLIYTVYTLHSRAVYQHDHGLFISYRVEIALSLSLSLSLCSYELKNVSQLHNTIE